MAASNIVRSLLSGVAKTAPPSLHSAPTRRAMVNIGLNVPDGTTITPEEALAALQKIGVKPMRHTVAQSDSEPTLIAELERALTPEEANAVSVMLRQEAIAQIDDTGAGDLFGPKADMWKPFNPDYFLAPSGRRISEEVANFADGGVVGGEGDDTLIGGGKADIIAKVGKGLLDFLDFGGVAGKKDIRDNIVNDKTMRGDGRKFKDFFADVTSGKSAKYKPSGLDNYDPAIGLGPDAAEFRALRDHFSGNFDNHIKTSIPGFDEVQNAVGSSLLKTYGDRGADMLDIGSSEGALIKALSAASEGRIRTTGIDPNPDMLRTYNEKPGAIGSRSILSAFGGADDAGKLAWEEADGTPIRYFDPEGQKYDAAHEAMVFQFISNARRAQAEEVKRLLKPKGIAIFEEKFGNQKDIFDANEAKKDIYKGLYYTPEQLDIKRKEVLNTGGDAVEGMNDLQVSQAEMEEIMRNTFKNRAQFWDSGNFKGYVGSDDIRALEDFLNNLQSTQSAYSTGPTPRGFSDGGPVTARDAESMTHDTSYGTGIDDAYLETLGERVNLGPSTVYHREDGTRYSPAEDGWQTMHDVGRLGVYGLGPAGAAVGASLDMTEALNTGDPTEAALAVMFGPGGKYAKAGVTGGLAYAMDPAEAEAGMYGKLAKWATTSHGQDALREAQKLEKAGADPETIRQSTDWFRDLDGQWKFELPSKSGSLDMRRGMKLGDVYYDPNVFEQYPQLSDLQFRRKHGEGAHYDPAVPEIVVGDYSKPAYNTPEMGGPKGLVDHELYHAKSDIEGWPQGMSAFRGEMKAVEDMKRFLGAPSGTPEFVVGKDLATNVSRDGGKSLGHARYEAEIGEALARREQLRREMNDFKIGEYSPVDPLMIDMPLNALFRPGEAAQPEQYRALLDYVKQLNANEMAAAQAAADEIKKKRKR